MGYTVIAPVGDNLDALFIGMKEFATQKVYLVTPKENMSKANEVKEKLKTFLIDTQIMQINEGLMEGMFESFGTVCKNHNHDDIIVNVATGDRLSTCAALSAAFANGLKAFGIMQNKPMLLPIMKLSYYNELSDSKMKILTLLKEDQSINLTQLSKKIGMSVSLLSYHLNGTLKYKGLVGLRLVEIQERNKNVLIVLSKLGSLLLKGYICQGKNC
jgi:hypothetical protein